jgi:hypothetical protein
MMYACLCPAVVYERESRSGMLMQHGTGSVQFNVLDFHKCLAPLQMHPTHAPCHPLTCRPLGSSLAGSFVFPVCPSHRVHACCPDTHYSLLHA